MRLIIFVFFFNDTATTEIYTLSLHDALPIFLHPMMTLCHQCAGRGGNGTSTLAACCSRATIAALAQRRIRRDRKSTRLNSSHANISYAVFCLKKKKATTDATSPSITSTTTFP